MPLDPSISLKSQTPNFLNTISSLAGTANALQQFQSGNIALQSQRQVNTERQNVIKLMQSDPAFKPGDDGVIPLTPENIAKLQGAAPQTYNEHLQRMATTNQNMTAARQSLLALGKDNAQIVAQAVSATQGQPMAERAAALEEVQKQFPGTKPFVDMVTHHMSVINNLNAPDTVKNQAIGNIDNFYSRFMSGVQEQQAMNTPALQAVNTGQQTQFFNIKPGVQGVPQGGVVASFQNKIAPSEQETVVTDPRTGNKFVQSKNPQGQVTGIRPIGGAGEPGTGGGGAYPTLAPGQMADIEQNQKEVSAVRSSADQANTQTYINKQIIDLSKNTNTGPGTTAWKNALSKYSGGLFDFNNHQELGKYLEKNAIAGMQAMGGPPSDARLSAAMAANGSTEFSPGALQEVTKFNDAVNTGLKQYRAGMDKAVGLKSPDYTELPRFKAEWAANVDPNIFRLENAIRDKDTMELTRLKHDLGASGMKALAQKRINLNSLSKTGHLP